MNNEQILEVVSKSIDEGFNVNNQLIEFVVDELNQMQLGLNEKQAQHLMNIIEYIAKSSAKNGAVAAINAINSILESSEHQ